MLVVEAAVPCLQRAVRVEQEAVVTGVEMRLPDQHQLPEVPILVAAVEEEARITTQMLLREVAALA